MQKPALSQGRKGTLDVVRVSALVRYCLVSSWKVNEFRITHSRKTITTRLLTCAFPPRSK